MRSSMNGYKSDMGSLQWRHFPKRKIQDRTGMLSYQLIMWLHRGQRERDQKTLVPVTRRWATTFKNDPQQSSRGMTIMSVIIYLPTLIDQTMLQAYVVFQTVRRT